MTMLTRAELFERIKANPRFVAAKPGAIVIVGAQGLALLGDESPDAVAQHGYPGRVDEQRDAEPEQR